MRLTVDPGSSAFVFDHLAGDDAARLRNHGLAMQAPKWVPQPAVVTRSEYAALPFWGDADGQAQAALASIRDEYNSSLALSGGGVYRCPLDHEYLPFQRAGLAYALQRKNTLIGDEMGLGKTIEAIGFANEIGARRVLVVCPASVRLHWRDMVAGTPDNPAWSVIPRVRVYPVMKSSDGVDPFANYVVISYNLLSSPGIQEALLKLHWDLLILDEVHYLKSVGALRTRATFGGLRTHGTGSIAEASERILALSGTPLPNRARECYAVTRHLCWDAIDWMSEDAFKRRYNPSRRVQRLVPDPAGGPPIIRTSVDERSGHLPELRTRLRCNLMVRRLMSNVMPQLPERRYELTYIEPNGAIRKALKAESLLGIDPEHLENVDPDVWGHVSTIRYEMGMAKVPRAIEFVKMLLTSEEKLFVLFHHRQVGLMLEEALAAYNPVLLIGGLGATKVHVRKEQFIRDPRHRVLLGQLEVAGTGLDGLQKVCRIATFVEASWTPKDNEQALYRLRRHGQTRGVLGQFLVAEGGWDEKILLKNHVKSVNIFTTLDGE